MDVTRLVTFVGGEGEETIAIIGQIGEDETMRG